MRGARVAASDHHARAGVMDPVRQRRSHRGISDLVGHSGTTVTESVHRLEIRPALTTDATAMNKILSKRTRSA